VAIVTDLVDSFATGPALVRRRLYDELRQRPRTSLVYVTDLSVESYENLAYAVGLPIPDSLVVMGGRRIRTAMGEEIELGDDVPKGTALSRALGQMGMAPEWVIVGGRLWDHESVRAQPYRGYALSRDEPGVVRRAAHDGRLYLTQKPNAAGHLEGLRRFGVIR
jgi:hypothetical protein